MKIVALLFLVAFVAFATASPRQYPHVSTETFRTPDEAHRNSAGKSGRKKPVDAVVGDQTTSEYWINKAKAFVDQKVRSSTNNKKAKNIVLFLGDGMSNPTVAATRVYMGGEEIQLEFEKFPNTASSKTYCVDYQVSDSGCAATALLHGVKANKMTIGVSSAAQPLNCQDSSDLRKHTQSIAAWAQRAGMATGIVTNTRVTDATPAAVYAHTTFRDFETDSDVKQSGCNANSVDDIAEQLVNGQVGKNLNVILGGGSRTFLDKSLSEHGASGSRSDGKNLIAQWKSMDTRRVYVNNTSDLLNVPRSTKQLLGLFSSSHFGYNLDVKRDGLQGSMPTLTQMTLKAIEILSQDKQGFFLLVEGGLIDMGHHETRAKYAIDETAEFSRAITAALTKLDLKETLVVATSDHGHTLSISGYAPRGYDIFGYQTGAFSPAIDNLPYMTLSYANGMGFYDHTSVKGGRVDLSTIDLSPNDFRFPATVPLSSETHGGEDVGIWAAGPWSHLIRGTMEQHVIPHIMAYASCIGDGLTMCNKY
ncbi:hypothetical protein HA402_004411 [Bradysia odoriphaga]|nr:hypothetical protein HA402_004411 [Bradysia odoriphaga]